MVRAKGVVNRVVPVSSQSETAGGAPWKSGSEHVAMSMDAGRRNEQGQALKKLEGRESKLLPPVQSGSGSRYTGPASSEMNPCPWPTASLACAVRAPAG